MKTPEEMAEEAIRWMKTLPPASERCNQCACEGYRAGYQAAQQWISVKERLPELNKHGYSEDVLLLSQVGRMEVSHIEKVKRVVKWRGIEPVIETENATPIEYFTHWMPLPEAPKGEK